MSQLDKPKRPTATAYRLGDDTLSLIGRLSEHLSAQLGLPVTATDVVRAGVLALAREHGLAPPPQKKQKK